MFNVQNDNLECPNSPSKVNQNLVIKPIVYGSLAFWLGKRAEESVSHKWSVYVRGEQNEDISYFVKEVVFTLHQSFKDNVRVIKKWPFILYEGGWGEFDIKISIHFIDDSIKPVEVTHSLKLYPSLAHVAQSTKKPIVSESYDEVIFVNPKPELYEILTNPINNKHMNINNLKDINKRELRDSKDEEKVEDIVDKMFIDDKNDNESEISQDRRDRYNMGDDMINLHMDNNNSGRISTRERGDKEREEQNQANYNNMDVDNDNSLSMVSNSMNEPSQNKKNINFIPNIDSYFTQIDDSVHYKTLDDALLFLNKEIVKIKNQIETNDQDCINIKKSIRELNKN